MDSNLKSIQPNMTSIRETVLLCKDAFQSWLAKDETLQSICEDYNKCAHALQYWEMSEQTEAPQRLQEYRVLLSELEEELRQYLIKSAPDRHLNVDVNNSDNLE